jgi:hypothetical protein
MKDKIENYEPVDMTGKIEEASLEGDLYWYGWIIPDKTKTVIDINLSLPYNSHKEAKLAKLELLSINDIEITDIFAVNSENEAHMQLLIKRFKIVLDDAINR